MTILQLLDLTHDQFIGLRVRHSRYSSYGVGSIIETYNPDSGDVSASFPMRMTPRLEFKVRWDKPSKKDEWYSSYVLEEAVQDGPVYGSHKDMPPRRRCDFLIFEQRKCPHPGTIEAIDGLEWLRFCEKHWPLAQEQYPGVQERIKG